MDCMMVETVQSYKDHMAQHGYRLPPDLTVGEFSRFPAPGKPKGNRSAWAVLSPTGVVNYGNWITGEQHTYSPSGHKPNEAEQRQLQERIKKEKAAADRQKLKRELAASKQARNIINAPSVRQAPAQATYLQRKRIQPHGILFGQALSYKDAIIIPVIGTASPFSGVVQSVQFVFADGEKRYLKGGRKLGGYYPVQWIETAPIVICEGFATGATLAEHYTPDSSVICAFDAGNLLAVARWFRQHYPGTQIIIAGDNDHQTERTMGINPGKSKAYFAAQAVAGSVSLPAFGPAENGSDWNDRWMLDNGGSQ